MRKNKKRGVKRVKEYIHVHVSHIPYLQLVNFEGLKFRILSLFSIIQWYFILWGRVTSIQMYRCGRG